MINKKQIHKLEGMTLQNLPLEREIELLDDFMLNDIIDAACFAEQLPKQSSPQFIPDNILLLALQIWAQRHPLSLPPCFAKAKERAQYFGATTVYEWPTA